MRINLRLLPTEARVNYARAEFASSVRLKTLSSMRFQRSDIVFVLQEMRLLV
jgi:hypothetical protein